MFRPGSTQTATSSPAKAGSSTVANMSCLFIEAPRPRHCFLGGFKVIFFQLGSVNCRLDFHLRPISFQLAASFLTPFVPIVS